MWLFSHILQRYNQALLQGCPAEQHGNKDNLAAILWNYNTCKRDVAFSVIYHVLGHAKFFHSLRLGQEHRKVTTKEPLESLLPPLLLFIVTWIMLKGLLSQSIGAQTRRACSASLSSKHSFGSRRTTFRTSHYSFNISRNEIQSNRQNAAEDQPTWVGGDRMEHIDHLQFLGGVVTRPCASELQPPTNFSHPEA